MKIFPQKISDLFATANFFFWLNSGAFLFLILVLFLNLRHFQKQTETRKNLQSLMYQAMFRQGDLFGYHLYLRQLKKQMESAFIPKSAENAAIALLIAKRYQTLNHPSKALAWLTRSRSLLPPQTEYALVFIDQVQGDCHTRLKQYQLANEYYQKALVRLQDNQTDPVAFASRYSNQLEPQLYAAIGLNEKKRGNFDLAQEYLQKSLESAKNNGLAPTYWHSYPIILYRLGQCLIEQNLNDQAQKIFEESILLFLNDVRYSGYLTPTYLQLALFDQKAGLLPEAQKSLQSAIRYQDLASPEELNIDILQDLKKAFR